MMKKYINLCLLGILFWGIGSVSAQEFGAWRKQYDEFKRQNRTAYENYKAQANAEFAEYLRLRWKSYSALRPDQEPLGVVQPRPERLPNVRPHQRPLPDPRPDLKQIEQHTQPIHTSTNKNKDKNTDKGEVKKDQPTKGKPSREGDILTSKNIGDRGEHLRIDFFGDALQIPWHKSLNAPLTTKDERGFSDVWRSWSKHSEKTVTALKTYGEAHRMNGWGYYQLVKQVSEMAYTEGQPDERIALQAYLLSQLNFKAQVATNARHLVLLLPFKEAVYGVSYLKIEGQKYYIYSYGHNPSAGFATYENKFKFADQRLSLAMDGGMHVGTKIRQEIQRWSAILGEQLHLDLPIGNVALMLNYPIVDGEVFYRQAVDRDIEQVVISTLRRKIKGMSERETVDFLLHLVQNGFKYATDDEMFGRQKQLMIEESFFYGQNNCKDRVGVFSWLIRRLTPLKIISVQYDGTPQSKGINHIATAIAFNDEVMGDAVIYKGKRYVVCDPTYINAGVGRQMPCYEGVRPNIAPLN